MKVAVNNIRVSLDCDMECLRRTTAKKLKISTDSIKSFRILKESVDARRKSSVSLVYSVAVELADQLPITPGGDIRILEDLPEEPILPGSKKLTHRPIVVGSGPAGLFAGLILSRYGYCPLILERGECVEKRTELVNRYWHGGPLDPDTNVQFGEGGAGTFSDGKLTTRINDRRCDQVLQEFHAAGAHDEILYKARPHIGTDVLKKVVVNMRRKIEDYGGEFLFRTRLASLVLKDGRVAGVRLGDGQEVPCEVLVLATGHSARDTYRELFSQGIPFAQKPFSIGVRIEHPQEIINRAQFGELAGHPVLGAADYQLFYKTVDRTVYSFCMCPGGLVVASASEPETIVTNGMSEYARDRENANSALVVSVGPGDYGGAHPLAGIEFQRYWERMAYKVGGGDGSAPVQRLEDFIHGIHSRGLGKVKPSYTGSVRVADLNGCLPDFITNPMKESIGYFDRKLQGFGMKDAVLTGVETRTSSPVRIPRGETLEAEGIRGLYPAGEGAGYAGGIVSAAVDGIRIAEQVIRSYAQPGGSGI